MNFYYKILFYNLYSRITEVQKLAKKNRQEEKRKQNKKEINYFQTFR